MLRGRVVVGRRLIEEGGAVPCLSPVLTDFPEISRKFEGLRLELVSRNFALVQQKPGPTPTSLVCAVFTTALRSVHLIAVRVCSVGIKQAN